MLKMSIVFILSLQNSSSLCEELFCNESMNTMDFLSMRFWLSPTSSNYVIMLVIYIILTSPKSIYLSGQGFLEFAFWFGMRPLKRTHEPETTLEASTGPPCDSFSIPSFDSREGVGVVQ